jgi:hypothetical protein
MDDETPEMEAITDEMRLVMRAWIDDPENEALKARYKALQDAYTRAFLEYRRSGGAQPSSKYATHQATRGG